MPGFSNRRSPSERWGSRAMSSRVTTVTGENVVSITGSTPIGGPLKPGGWGVPGRARIGLGDVTTISGRVSCAPALNESEQAARVTTPAPAIRLAKSMDTIPFCYFVT